MDSAQASTERDLDGAEHAGVAKSLRLEVVHSPDESEIGRAHV